MRKVRHVVGCEVPAMQDARGDRGRLVAMATGAEEFAEILAVAVPPHVTCNTERNADV